MVGITDNVIAYQFDLAVRQVGVAWENEQIETERPRSDEVKGPKFSPKFSGKPMGSWSEFRGIGNVKFETVTTP